MAKLGKYEISIDPISDSTLRDNFKNLVAYLLGNPVNRSDFKFFTFTAVAPGTFTVPHNLGFQPMDVIGLSINRPDIASLTWQYDRFTTTTVTFTINWTVSVTNPGPCTIRAFIGRYKENG